METKTMVKLRADIENDGIVIRYKDFVIVAEFMTGLDGEWFEAKVYQPIETEDETSLDFAELRLEEITEWNRRYGTEGEALKAAMDFVEWKY